MTLIISTLFMLAMMLSVYAMATSVKGAMPRIMRVIAERGELASDARIIRVGAVRNTARSGAAVISFAAHARKQAVPLNAELLKLAA